MPEPAHEEIRRVFDLVFDAEPEDREAVLARECGDDDALRQRVRAMIAAGDERFLAQPTAASRPTVDGPAASGPPAATAAPLPGSEQPGEIIGRYKLLQLIGEGGFGRVWMAEQREPVRRRVAVKVIRIGMDTEQVIARFEAERQALAMMDHPNIAKVLDAGATATGRPYFVMEYIRGVSLVEYCDTEQLDTAARLDLFARVCQAIQHAHQKGIIHRDIKPGNVLVTMHDGAPVPKVIDFGIAKATSQELTTRTLFTEHRQMIGTPAYMSPEQAEMSGLDIDTRSDIYSLGVLLYELLTGTTPFDVRTLMDAGFAEMVRIIREETPAKPSTRLSTLGDTAAQVAARRRADPERLGGRLRGDLDWIVMKCLEKDRTRRYETAMALADDVRRHLGDEPVLAGPPSAGYRIRKFVRRNRAAVSAACLMLLVLVLGVVGTSTGLVMARAEATRADRAAEEAEALAASEAEARATAEQLAVSEAEARAVAEENERRATSEAARAERELARAVEIKQLILTMFDGIRPQVARGADIALLKAIIDDAAARLAAGAIGDELVAAELHSVVGNAYLQLRLVEEAARHLPVTLEIRERRLPADDQASVLAAHDVAMLRSAQGRREEAAVRYEQVIERMVRLFGPESNTTLNAMNNLGIVLLQQGLDADALAMFEGVLDGRRRTLGEEHPDTVRTLSFTGVAMENLDQLGEAATRLESALERQLVEPGEDHPDTMGTMTSLAKVRLKQGRLDEAEALLRRALEQKRVVLGEDADLTRTARRTLASVAEARGRMAEAGAMREELLAESRGGERPQHRRTVGDLVNLGLQRRNEGRLEEAESMLRKALELGEEHLEEREAFVLNARDALIDVLLRQGRGGDARPLLERSLSIHRELGGPEHPRTLEAMERLALVAARAGELPLAEALGRERIEILRRTAGPGDPVTLRAANNLGRFIDGQGRAEEAEPFYLECLDGMRALHGDGHRALIPPLINLAILYWKLERHPDAEAAYLEVIELRTVHLGPEHPETLGATTDLGMVLISAGRHGEAVAPLERSLPVKRRVLGPTHPWTRFARNSLADAYLALGRTEDAAGLQRERLDLATVAAEAEDAAPEVLEKAARLLLDIEPAALRRPDDALAYAERATEVREAAGGPPLAEALRLVAAARAAAGDLAGAVTAQRRAITLAPESDRSTLQETLEGYLREQTEAPAGG